MILGGNDGQDLQPKSGKGKRVAWKSDEWTAAYKGRVEEFLKDLGERKVLWLSAWTIHHANHLRPNRDGLKVGGHQASCASSATILSALYLAALRPELQAAAARVGVPCTFAAAL